MILREIDVQAVLTMGEAVGVIRKAFAARAAGDLLAPPRFRVESPQGAMVFTAGATTGARPLLGFRVYDTFPRGLQGEQDQIVVVYDAEAGRLKGLILGRILGAMRTGAIGGVAIDTLARQDTAVLSVIGAGYQARTQVEAALAVRDFAEIVIFNRSPERAAAFCAELSAQYGRTCRLTTTAEEAVHVADVLICATTSKTAVLHSAWIRPGTHVTTIGPQTTAAHELPLDILHVADVVATDSIPQSQAFDAPFFIPEDRLVALDQIISGAAAGRVTEAQITLFCSVGLAGTEVLLGDYVLEQAAAKLIR
jgi:ornithine cyclodeaminase/alanine dehydrogenase-like protein (mu-crystallin family)